MFYIEVLEVMGKVLILEMALMLFISILMTLLI
jgi:hypothetical protein